MKKNSGITLIALVVTIVVIAILISVGLLGVETPNRVDKEAKNNKKTYELQEVGQAVLETYIKYRQTGNEDYLIGTPCDRSNLAMYENELGIIFEDSTYSDYFILDSEENLNKIGIKSSSDYYIVNYKTGEVLNYTTKKNSDGTVLYIKGAE